MSIPEFTAERALFALGSYRIHHVKQATTERSQDTSANNIVPAVPMVYCKYVRVMVPCGSPLPGYPTPMCPSWEQQCWIHDSGSYVNAGYMLVGHGV